MSINKRNFLLPLIIGNVTGMIIMIIVIYLITPSMMMKEDKISMNFDEAVQQFEESVKKHEWSIPHVHDLKKSMAKFGQDVRNVKVFELCHPDHAGKILALSDERIVS